MIGVNWYELDISVIWMFLHIIFILFKILRFIENVPWSMLSYPNETSKECIQFL